MERTHVRCYGLWEILRRSFLSLRNLGIVLALAMQGTLTAAPELRPLRDGTDLFVDDVNIAHKHGVVRTVHAATKLDHPVLVADRPCERGSGVYLYGTTHYDPAAGLMVEVLDVRGRVLDGYAAADCTVLDTDQRRHPVRWTRHAAPPADQPFRVRFRLNNASLYSYTFTRP